MNHGLFNDKGAFGIFGFYFFQQEILSFDSDVSACQIENKIKCKVFTIVTQKSYKFVNKWEFTSTS